MKGKRSLKKSARSALSHSAPRLATSASRASSTQRSPGLAPTSASNAKTPRSQSRRYEAARRGWLPRRVDHSQLREVPYWPLPRRQLKKRRGLKLGVMWLHAEVGYLGDHSQLREVTDWPLAFFYLRQRF